MITSKIYFIYFNYRANTMKISESTSRPDREPKKGDKVRDPDINPKRLRPFREKREPNEEEQKKSSKTVKRPSK